MVQGEFRQAVAAAMMAVAAAVVVACKPSGDQPVPAPKVTQAPAPVALAADPADTTPKASDVFKEKAPPDKTSGNARPMDPLHSMTRQEESTAMPMPGQVNDHSTLAKEPVKR